MRRLFPDLRSVQSLRAAFAVGICVLVTSLASPRVEGAESLVVPGARVAVIGDSITEQRTYSKYIEAYLLACSGVPDVKVMQFGWSGETATGFAARLENDLTPFKPSVVTLCYGMNDGGYRPYTEQGGKSYETAMRNVLKKLGDLGVKSIVVGSPGAVDDYFFRPGQMFGDVPAHASYNDNLSRLRDIDRKLATEGKLGFADVHGAMFDAMKKAQAALGPKYHVCGSDGFHPGPNGQLLMAYAFLKGLGVDGNIGEINIDLKSGDASGTVETTSTRWPFCFDGDAVSPNGTRSILPFTPFNADLNRYTLKVANLDAPKAKVQWGSETKEFTREQLAAGVNLPAEFTTTPFDKPFQQLLGAIAAKEAFETSIVKQVITNFRSIPAELKSDPEILAAQKTIADKLMARHAKLDAEVRTFILPVKHTITVTPLK